VAVAAWAFEGAEGGPFDAIVILAIIVLNAILGYAQEARAEEAVSALQQTAAPTARVPRDVRAQRIAATELVPGDVLLVAEGDAVSADGRLVEAASLMVAEASLTWESEPVPKDPGPVAGTAALGDRLNMASTGRPSRAAAAWRSSPPRGWPPRWAASPACSARPRARRRRFSARWPGSGASSDAR
jgi:Ca2+-transporting ATPase